MASNSFGKHFRMTTWGESHGKALGVVIDGCPAGLPLTQKEIQEEVSQRKPGANPYTSARKETDSIEILSGVFQEVTTGTPILIQIKNQDACSKHYHSISHLYRPGHANFTYLEKYGYFDYRGGGRSSARETVGRVAAGAIAKKILSLWNISVLAYVKSIGSIEAHTPQLSIEELKVLKNSTHFLCPDPLASQKIQKLMTQLIEEGNSIGGIIECQTSALPIGLGEPIYEKLEANLAKAMLSLPASKGFEIGMGFNAACMKGSEYNDLFEVKNQNIQTASNRCGGTLGGISTGSPLLFRVPFKPTSSIALDQITVDTQGRKKILRYPSKSRHDPCVVLRCPPIVEAMTAVTLVDHLLWMQNSRIDKIRQTHHEYQGHSTLSWQ